MKLDWKWLVALAITLGGMIIGAAGCAGVACRAGNRSTRSRLA